MKSKHLHIEQSGFPISDLAFGSLYLLFSARADVQRDWLQSPSIAANEIAFVNGSFPEAHKIHPYLKKHRRQLDVIALKKANGVEHIDIHTGDLPGELLLIMLKEILSNSILAVETTGLGPQAIIYIVECSLSLLDRHPDKIILLVQKETIGRSFPDFLLKKVEKHQLQECRQWIDSIGKPLSNIEK